MQKRSKQKYVYSAGPRQISYPAWSKESEFKNKVWLYVCVSISVFVCEVNHASSIYPASDFSSLRLYLYNGCTVLWDPWEMQSITI